MTSLRSKLLTAAAVLSMLFASSIGSAQWVQTNGPYGAHITHLAAMGKTLFAATEGGIGLYRSIDNATSWNPAANGLSNPYILAFLEVGTKVFIATNGAVFVSIDSGQAWTIVSSGLYGNITSLATNGTHLFAATFGSGVFHSSDSGASWVANTDSIDKSVSDLAATSVGILAWGASGAILSTDNGSSWQAFTGLPNNAHAPIAASGTNVYVATDTSLLRSTDNGLTWATAFEFSSANMGVNSLLIDGNTLIAGCGKGAFLSKDSGASWTNASKGLTQNSVQTIVASGTELIAGSWGGIFVSSDTGANWAYRCAGMRENTISALAATGSILLAGTDGEGIFRSTNAGNNWFLQGTDWGVSQVRAFALADSIMFAGGAGVFASTDSGLSWTESPNTTVAAEPIDAFALIGRDVFAGSDGGSGVFRSSDRGVNWVSASNGLPYSDVGNVNVHALAVSEGNLFAASALDGRGRVYVSNDDGATWNREDSGLPPSAQIESVSAFAVLGTEVLAAAITYADSNIFRSSDFGTSWTVASKGFPMRTYASAFAVDGALLLAGTNKGVFLSTDTGRSWRPVNTGLVDTEIHSLVINNGVVFAGTYQGGVWRRPLSEMIGTSDVAEQPKASGIKAQAYPNPFSEKTTIRFTCAERGPVHLSLVNLLGVEIARLFSGELDAGEHAFEWDAHATGGATGDGCATPGVYFCIVRMGGQDVRPTPMMLSR